MKRIITKKIIVVFLSFFLSLLLFSSLFSLAYTNQGWRIVETKVFIPYNEFGTTTISHFNEAMYQWNSNAGISGLDLMRRSPTERHYSTSYPENDGICRVYRVNTGTNDYVGQTTSYYYVTSYTELLSADINLNMYYNWANSAQENKFDVWSVFLHETGHVAGLDHSTSSNAVMYSMISTNTEKRYLTQDDLDGLQSIYGNQIHLAVFDDPPNKFGDESDNNVEIVSGTLEDYTLNDLILKSNLIIKAKIVGQSDTFEIDPVFGDSTGLFTDYYFEVEDVLKGTLQNKDRVTVRLEGGSIENRTVVVDNNPLFETESDVILCLYKPDMGSGYNTKGDYYYLRGISQGVFDIQNDKLICKHDGSIIINDKFKQMLRDHSSDEDYSLKSEFQNNMLQNLESGFINEKEYDQFLKEINQYAEIK